MILWRFFWPAKSYNPFLLKPYRLGLVSADIDRFHYCQESLHVTPRTLFTYHWWEMGRKNKNPTSFYAWLSYGFIVHWVQQQALTYKMGRGLQPTFKTILDPQGKTPLPPATAYPSRWHGALLSHHWANCNVCRMATSFGSNTLTVGHLQFAYLDLCLQEDSDYNRLKTMVLQPVSYQCWISLQSAGHASLKTAQWFPVYD